MLTDAAWAKWGETDPYYGVLTAPRFRSASIEAHRDEFFATGEDYIARIVATAERVFGIAARRRALDFGCGVGRLALPLAKRFATVVGVDIAPAMLAEAARNADRHGLGNLTVELSDDRLSRITGEFDLINSYIVLQHIPVQRGLAIIGALLDRLAAGGIACLHFSVRRRATLRTRLSYFVRHRVPFGALAINLLKGNPPGDAPMQMNEYPLPVVLDMFEARGITESHQFVEVHNGVTTVTLLARRGLMSPLPA